MIKVILIFCHLCSSFPFFLLFIINAKKTIKRNSFFSPFLFVIYNSFNQKEIERNSLFLSRKMKNQYSSLFVFLFVFFCFFLVPLFNLHLMFVFCVFFLIKRKRVDIALKIKQTSKLI